MQIIDYIHPEIISHIPNYYISKESDYYEIWEKQRGNQFWSNLYFSKVINPEIRPLIKI